MKEKKQFTYLIEIGLAGKRSLFCTRDLTCLAELLQTLSERHMDVSYLNTKRLEDLEEAKI